MSMYLIVEDGVIVNRIVCDDDFAKAIGALPDYEGADIGKPYNPPPVVAPPTEMDKLMAQVTYTAMKTNTLIPQEVKTNV